ncbi:hypothetical protein KCU74_g8348, partial [Aureobasidium melanogenum]
MVTTRNGALKERRVTRRSTAAAKAGSSGIAKRYATTTDQNIRRRTTTKKNQKTVAAKQSVSKPTTSTNTSPTVDASATPTFRPTTRSMTKNTMDLINIATPQPPTKPGKGSARHAQPSSKQVPTKPSINKAATSKNKRSSVSKVNKTPIKSSNEASSRPHTRQMTNSGITLPTSQPSSDPLAASRTQKMPNTAKATATLPRRPTTRSTNNVLGPERNSPSLPEPTVTTTTDPDPDPEPENEISEDQQATQEVADDYVGPSPNFREDGLYYVAESQMSVWARANRRLLRSALQSTTPWAELTHGQRREVLRCYEAVSFGLVRDYQEFLDLPLSHGVWTDTIHRGWAIIEAAGEWFDLMAGIMEPGEEGEDDDSHN